MSFKSVLLGTSAHKNYTHNLSFDNNTTMDFGFFQPLLSQYMLPNSTIKVDSKQLVRLAPMPTPSFARMYLQNYARFVKMTDVVPYYESLLSGISFTTSSGYTVKPVRMPVTTNSFLLWYLLTMSRCTVYERYVLNPNKPPLEYGWRPIKFVNNVHVDWVRKLLLNRFSFDASVIVNRVPTLVSIDDFVISPMQADYILRADYVGDGRDGQYMLCFEFSSDAKHIRKQFLGLGYSLNGEDNKPVSIAPLLAYYKAYYDYFGLTREKQFEQTACFRIIGLIWDYYTSFYQLDDTVISINLAVFMDFLFEFANLYYTDASSYIASHRSLPMNDAAPRLPDINTGDWSLVDYASTTSSASRTYLQPNMFGIPANPASPPQFTWLSIDLLRRLTRFVSKDSVIGKRLSDWVKVHYGSNVSFNLFQDCFNISEWRTAIDIDDVFSTSETADVGNANKGDYLGAYAGKGIGFGKGGFSFKAPTHGFVFVMSCIVPITNVFQGNDPTLYAIDNDTIPHPEFDALGYEFTPKGVFLSDNFLLGEKDDLNLTKGGFGWVPRYTGFKVKKNIVNGDMCCGYYKRDLLPYFNDRLILSHSASLTPITDEKGVETGNYKFSIANNNVPSASTSWQQICKYGFLTNYNRLFYNSKADLVDDFYFKSRPLEYGLNDNFIAQTVFDVRVTNWLKPVQNSYDTVDEVDNSTISQSTN